MDSYNLKPEKFRNVEETKDNKEKKMKTKLISIILTILILISVSLMGDVQATANISNNDGYGYSYSYDNPDDNDDNDNSYWSYWNKKYNTINNTNITETNQTYGNYIKIVNDTQTDDNGDGITFTPKNATYLPKEPQPYNWIEKLIVAFILIFITYKIVTIFIINKKPTYNTHSYPENKEEFDDFSDDNDGNKSL